MDAGSLNLLSLWQIYTFNSEASRVSHNRSALLLESFVIQMLYNADSTSYEKDKKMASLSLYDKMQTTRWTAHSQSVPACKNFKCNKFVSDSLLFLSLFLLAASEPVNPFMWKLLIDFFRCSFDTLLLKKKNASDLLVISFCWSIACALTVSPFQLPRQRVYSG